MKRELKVAFRFYLRTAGTTAGAGDLSGLDNVDLCRGVERKSSSYNDAANKTQNKLATNNPAIITLVSQVTTPAILFELS